jgi:hypothetical protein
MNLDQILTQLKIEESIKEMNPLDELINYYPISTSINCGILVQSGKLIL